jgi:hypothetical protein
VNLIPIGSVDPEEITDVFVRGSPV